MPDDRVKAGNPPTRRKPILSIRARLMVLALVAIAPLTFERVRGLEAARADRTQRAYAEVSDLARRGADAQEEVVSSVRALLQIVAHVYARVPFEQGDCNDYLRDMASNIPWIQAISVAEPDGQIRCSTEPRAIGLNIGERPHFQQALRKRDFAVSDYFINVTHRAPSVYAAFPAMGRDHAVRAVVLASIDLQWMNRLAASVAEQPGSTVLLIDGSGTLVAASANEQNDIGKNFAGVPLVRDLLAHGQGTAAGAGLDGVRRIFGYVRVPYTAAHLAVGLDERALHNSIDHAIGVAYVQLALTGLFVLLVTWFGGEQLIVRPIRSLVRTVGQFGRGNLHVRASRERWVAEFVPLAAAFDEMADKLAAREEELHIANEHLDELASLDGLTGLANRRGFDRELERAWQRAIDCRQPMALMMIDIDHFKLYNDRYGHVAGDTCLRAVGETLSLVTLDQAVLVARYGGEEFALLLPGLDLPQAAALAEEARRAVEDLMITHAEAPCGFVTISIGVQSLTPQENRPAAALVEAADHALYAAKHNGRNTVVAHAAERLRLAS